MSSTNYGACGTYVGDTEERTYIEPGCRLTNCTFEADKGCFIRSCCGFRGDKCTFKAKRSANGTPRGVIACGAEQTNEIGSDYKHCLRDCTITNSAVRPKGWMRDTSCHNFLGTITNREGGSFKRDRVPQTAAALYTDLSRGLGNNAGLMTTNKCAHVSNNLINIWRLDDPHYTEPGDMYPETHVHEKLGNIILPQNGESWRNLIRQLSKTAEPGDLSWAIKHFVDEFGDRHQRLNEQLAAQDTSKGKGLAPRTNTLSSLFRSRPASSHTTQTTQASRASQSSRASQASVTVPDPDGPPPEYEEKPKKC